MTTTLLTQDDKMTQNILLELMFTPKEQWQNQEGVTSMELSRKLGIKNEEVKKKLKLLLDKRIVRCSGVNPKFWNFDEYNFSRLDESDPVFMLLYKIDDVDFSKYFEY